MLLVLIFTPFFLLTAASPATTFSINSQIPPLAQVGHDYAYQFTATTFSSPNTLSYSLINAPAWLSVDSDTRTFSGTPKTQNVGSATFTLQATDKTGEASMQVTLIVVDSLYISVPTAVTSQLARFGQLENSDTLAMYTSSSFSFSFALNTFQGPAGVTYYATSADRSPLPSWISFQASTLTISGLTPPLTAIPQSFGVTVIATTVPGYAAASFTFYIVVNDHRLTFLPYQNSVKFANGSADLSTIIDDGLQLDGQPLSAANLTNTSISGPGWLSYNAGNFMLSGSPPAGVANQDITLTAIDIYGDTADSLVHVHFQSSLFAQNVGMLSAKIGQPFNYTFPRSLFSQSGVSVTVNLASASTWLKFTQSTLTLSGVVPSTIQPSIVNASLTASLGGVSETQGFQIFIQQAAMASSSSSSMATSSATSGASGTASNSAAAIGNPGSRQLSAGAIAGIVIGCMVAASILACLGMCCLRRRAQKHEEGEKGQESAMTSRLDSPPRSAGRGAMVESHAVGENVSNTHQIRGHINGIEDSIRSSKFSMLRPSEDTVPSEPHLAAEGAWPLLTDERGHANSRSALNQIQGPRIAKQAQRASAISRRSSQRSMGLPSECVAVGLGHGRPSYQSWSREGSMSRSNSLQNRWSTFSSGLGSRRSQNTYSFIGQERRHPRISEESGRTTIRVVEGSEEARLDALQRKRDSYIRRRASSKRKSNPLFAANSLRQSTRRSVSLTAGALRDATSHWGSGRWRRSTSRTSRSSSLGITRPLVPGRDKVTQASLTHSGKSGEWEDLSETDGSGSVYEEDVMEGEDMVQTEAGSGGGFDLGRDGIVTAKRRGELARAARLGGTVGRRGPTDLPLPQIPAGHARETSSGQSSMRSGKAFL